MCTVKKKDLFKFIKQNLFGGVVAGVFSFQVSAFMFGILYTKKISIQLSVLDGVGDVSIHNDDPKIHGLVVLPPVLAPFHTIFVELF